MNKLIIFWEFNIKNFIFIYSNGDGDGDWGLAQSPIPNEEYLYVSNHLKLFG